MQQIVSFWTELDMRRRLVLGLALLAVGITLWTLIRMATAPTMTLLYAGLEQGAAGDVVQSLEQRGVAFEVRGGSIFVDAAQRDSLRMTLASEGLPSNSNKGYELLDTLNGFGTTSQMFDAAYWRAKEGELARTIVSNRYISNARVHIANTSSSPFVRSAKPSASVSVTATGGTLTSEQAQALRHLVAAAVAGLSAEDVTLIDSSGAILGGNDDATLAAPGTDRADQLRERVARLVEARVGAGNAVVEVSVDTVTETESFRERRFDPESRVAISTDTEERSNSSTEQSAGVTVASNLPDGDAGDGDGRSAETSETRERVNYEVSETEREVLRAPGAIRRLTVAVLVNGIRETGDSGEQTYRERSEEELTTLRDLVASAVGFDEARGDVITIRSMEMPSILLEGTQAQTSFFSGLHIDAMAIIQMAVLAIVALTLALFVIRPLLMRPAKAVAELPALPPAEFDTDMPGAALTGELSLDTAPLPALGDEPMADLQIASSDPVERLRSMIGDRQEETVEILRNWLEDEEKTA